MPLTARETESAHLLEAAGYAQPLEAERMEHTDPYSPETRLAALQGEAMRMVIFHCTAALIAALDRRR